MVPAWSLAQPGTDLDRDVQRAILLGKAGEFARGLEVVEVHLGQDIRHAEAWFMSGFLLKEWYKQSDNRAHRQEAMQRLATSLDLQSAQGRPADWLPQARRALGYLGDDCYDDAVAAVNTFQTGDEVNVLALVDQYAMAVEALKPGTDLSAERAAFHKNMAHAHATLYAATSDDVHFEGLQANYREALALGVLRAHVPDETPRDAVAGAEYWVQIRQRRDGGLGFHFDKDERAHAERGEWHHPMLASATYLTHGGAPLAIFDTTSDGQGPVRRAWLVSPQRGRHVAFLGDRLHGVPAELAPEGPYATRVSVLVNLWDKKPVGVSRAPGGEACEPFALCFAHKVTPPIAVVQPDDYLLYEHRDGDTGPIPKERWRAEALGALEYQEDMDEESLVSVAAWNAPVVERQECRAVEVLLDALRELQATESVERPAGAVEAMYSVPSQRMQHANASIKRGHARFQHEYTTIDW